MHKEGNRIVETPVEARVSFLVGRCSWSSP